MNQMLELARGLDEIIAAGRRPDEEAVGKVVRTGQRVAKFLEVRAIATLSDLMLSPAFQRLALRPIEMLCSPNASTERRLVDALKDELRSTATVLTDFVRTHADLLNPLIDRAVKRRDLACGKAVFPCEVWITAKSVTAVKVSDGVVAAMKQPRVATVTAETMLQRLQAAFLHCDANWTDRHEYFGWVRERTIDLNPNFDLHHQLTHVGNFIARNLLARTMSVWDELEDIGEALNTTLISANSTLPRGWTEILCSARQKTEELRGAILTSADAATIEAAVALVQTVTEFSSTELDLGWLQLPQEVFRRQRGELRRALISARGLETAQRIQHAFELIGRWRSHRDDGETSLEEAIATRGLVLDASKRQVFWEGVLIPTDWNARRKPWDLLLALARARGREVNESAVYDADTASGDHALRTLKNRLCTYLPPTLRETIKAGSARTYRLDLPANVIHLHPAAKRT